MYRRQYRRHPTDRRPQWLKNLEREVKYWLTATSHRRHPLSFNKSRRGRLRRNERRTILQLRKNIEE